MHIVIDCRFVNHSGVGRYIREIVTRLVKQPLHRFTLVVSAKEVNSRFFEQCTLSNVKFVYCSAEMCSIREQFELPLKIPACDVFWAPHYNAPILPVRAVRKIVTIHDAGHLAMQEGLSMIKRLYARLLMYTSTHWYDLVLTDSFFSKSEILKYEHIDEAKVKVQYCAVDTAQYKEVKDQVLLNQVRERYHLPKAYFLCVGNIKPNKNIIRLLKAYAYFLAHTEIKIELVIVGKRDGLLTGVKGIESVIDGLGIRKYVKFTGFVEDCHLPALYSMAEAFLFPSLYEGFGLPPLEAMACGCPVLVSNSASIPEICGDAARYFDPYDIEDIRKCLERFMQDIRLSDVLYRKELMIIKRYSWDGTSDQILSILLGNYL